MRVQPYVPQDPILQKSVECIYIIEHPENSKSASYLILPSVYSYLSVSLNTVSETISENTVLVRGVLNNSLDSDVQLGLKTSCVYRYQGRVRELCVRFTRLGIYDFFDEKVLLKSINSSEPFIPDDNYRKTITDILNYSSDDEIFAGIEKYLLGRYSPFSHPYLNDVIGELERAGSEKPPGIEALARSCGVTRQTLTTQFKKYLNLSPSEFRQICRFRELIESKLDDEHKTGLTDYVYDFGFFDESHLRKEFKKYIFLKPNDFFRKIYRSPDENVMVIWS
jgi:AraC-like DNA-binding protein